MNRRTFLQRTGLVAVAGLLAGQVEAAPVVEEDPGELSRLKYLYDRGWMSRKTLREQLGIGDVIHDGWAKQNPTGLGWG